MNNPWFRLYNEFDSDPKVQSMPEVMQRRLIMLFCSRCRGETLQETERAFHWRIGDSELATTKALFLEKGFIDEKWNLINWNHRQFLSDSSTDRVRRHRQAMKQDETLHETEGNVTVTPPDTDTDTEQSQKQKEPLASTANAVPADKGKLLGTLPLNDGTDWEVWSADADELQPLYPAVDVRQELRAMKGWLIGNPTLRKTKRGIRRFITSWLGKEQDKAKPNRGNIHGNGKFQRSQASTQRVLAEILGSPGEVGVAAPPGGRALEAGTGA